MYTLTTDNKHHCWDSILAAMSVLNTYVVHDLNSLDAYTLHTVHEQDSVVARYERTSYVHAWYCLHAIQHVILYMHTLLMCNSQNFLSDSTSTCAQMSSLN